MRLRSAMDLARRKTGQFVFQHLINPHTVGAIRHRELVSDYSHGFFYDELFAGDGVDTKAALFLCAKRETRILDLGGGTGRLAFALAEAGHIITVVDQSSQILALAQKRLDDLVSAKDHIRLIHEDARTVKLAPNYDLIFSLNYLLEHLPNDEAVLQLLKNIRTGMSPNTRFFLEVHYAPNIEKEVTWNSGKWHFEREAKIDGSRYRLWARTIRNAASDSVRCEHAVADTGLRFVFLETPLRILPQQHWESLFEKVGFHILNRWGSWTFQPVSKDCPKLIFELSL